MAAGILATLITGVSAVFWRNRRDLRLLWGAVPYRRTTRVSVSALLRIRDDDFCVLFHTPYTSGSYGPPGGVCKYRSTAEPDLERIGFRPQRVAREGDPMRADLRGFVPRQKLPAFARWVRKGADRESGPECLRRELVEELAEIGHPELVYGIEKLDFMLIRTVVDGPHRVPGRDYRQIRFHHVYNLVTNDSRAVELRERLLELGRDGSEEYVICASGDDIIQGRQGDHLIGSHTAFLIGARKVWGELPSIR
ncbi:hypothetical protein BJY14_004011 [Actinomadura luteofluorescens]|uniref:CD-NTase-associated protein 16 NUDIX domain-containing protein n=1 Tax=Actinomadura luteofluorescens TaxID=46163 RepID=A0A7Y9EHY8_9ACTN|nr:hypothetical protein [Actinomadura luteofluorescens]